MWSENYVNEGMASTQGGIERDAMQCYHEVMSCITEGRDTFSVRNLMDRWYMYLHQASGAQGTAASFMMNMKMGMVNGGGYEFLDDKGNTPLFWAAYYDRSDILGMLINEYKFAVNRQNFNGDTALHFAVKGASLDCVKVLLELGADVNASNLQSEYPLHMATCSGLDYVQLLLDKGVNCECEDECGDTPLHWAVREDNFDAVDLLAQYGANLHHQNEDGESPLMFAEIFGTKHKLRCEQTIYNTESSPMNFEQTQQMPMYSFSAENYQSSHNVPQLFYNEYH